MELLLQSIIAFAAIIGTGIAIMTFVSNRIDKRIKRPWDLDFFERILMSKAE